jgi:hypothetical protein
VRDNVGQDCAQRFESMSSWTTDVIRSRSENAPSSCLRLQYVRMYTEYTYIHTCIGISLACNKSVWNGAGVVFSGHVTRRKGAGIYFIFMVGLPVGWEE